MQVRPGLKHWTVQESREARLGSLINWLWSNSPHYKIPNGFPHGSSRATKAWILDTGRTAFAPLTSTLNHITQRL